MAGEFKIRNKGIILDADGVAARRAAIETGTGAPSASKPIGSLYLRTDGGADTCFYVNIDGSTTWKASRLTLDAPMDYKGAIALAADFPTSTAVQSGDIYTVTSNVTDNDATKTNTGQSFLAADEIVWNGTNWTNLGTLRYHASTHGHGGADPLTSVPDSVVIGAGPTTLANVVSIVTDAEIVALAGLDATGGMLAQTGAGAFAKRTMASGGDGISVANGDGVAGAPTISPANDLAALEALDATAGLLAKTAAETYARRTLTAPAAGITVSNGDGQAGNPTLALADDLAALEALDATAGLLAKTAANTYARRTLTGTADQVAVADGDGQAGNPTLSLPAAITDRTSMLTPAAAGTGGTLTLAEPTGGGSKVVTLAAPALAADRAISIPDADVDLSKIASTETALGKIVSGDATILLGAAFVDIALAAGYNGKPAVAGMAGADATATQVISAIWQGGGILRITANAPATGDVHVSYIVDGR